MDRSLKNTIHESRWLLQNPYAYLNGEGGYDAVVSGTPAGVHEARNQAQDPCAYVDESVGFDEWIESYREARPRQRVIIPPDTLLNRGTKGKRFSRKDIEEIARQLQVQMWHRRQELLPTLTEIEPLNVLDPVLALEAIGYSVDFPESLGQYREQGESFEVAGILDNDNCRVAISKRFSREICNFTTAHELGHALLHEGSGLHRDRALDGTLTRQARSLSEIEADNFAAYFLLPEKQVRKAFVRIFLTERFALNETTAFALVAETRPVLQSNCITIRQLTRRLASAEYYNGVRFKSIARQFGVSIEAMAIRLEELGLVESPR